ncbi:hypothetical protein BKA65DRAFT_546242 [Rhexocercosporidium sp. MPI-PUGE-AT-0058]|nr:hypothetical protein BKA65DRAFT_546242 [Rhexocercosporidium sp. MPI-PUGE-AT-0058]
MASNVKATKQAPTLARKTPNQMTLFDKREQLITLRLESLERRRKILGPQDKWPTIKGVRAYKDEQAKLAAQALSAPVVSPTPTAIRATSLSPQTTRVGSSSQGTTASGIISSRTKLNDRDSPYLAALPTPTSSPSFAFPVTICKPLGSFSQFSLLPTELRLQIWEIAESSPRFIEAQYCSDFYQPTFVNVPDRNALMLVCRESAEVLSKRKLMLPRGETSKITMIPITDYSHPHLTFSQRQRAMQRGQKSEDWPVTAIHYNPSRDTIFLRSLDFSDSFPFTWFSEFRRYFDVSGIQHLALPFDAASLSSASKWIATLRLMRNLKSLTLMIGSNEKSWGKGGAVELRPLHQWFADGRMRWIGHSGEQAVLVSPLELMTWFLHLDDRFLNRGGAVVPNRTTRPMTKISVRIVAWKRN